MVQIQANCIQQSLSAEIPEWVSLTASRRGGVSPKAINELKDIIITVNIRKRVIVVARLKITEVKYHNPIAVFFQHITASLYQFAFRVRTDKAAISLKQIWLDDESAFTGT